MAQEDIDEAVQTGEHELLLPPMLAGEEVKIAPLGVEELSVSGQSSLVRLPAPDEGQGGGLVVEAEVPPPVVGALQPVEGAAGVHRDLAEHAQRAPSLRLPLGLQQNDLLI